MRTARVGVLGGTFNPIHYGHLHLAESIRSLFSLSHVYFVVATMPPHKRRQDLIPFVHRYAMVSLALAGARRFVPSMIELEPEPSPFTIDTLKKLDRSAGRADRSLYFLAGGDSLAEIQTWRDSEKLLESYNFVFALRPGVRPFSWQKVLPGKAIGRVRDFTGWSPARIRRSLREEGDSERRIYLVDVDAPDISATRIRRLAASGKSLRRLVPGPVGDYIGKHRLYGER